MKNLRKSDTARNPRRHFRCTRICRRFDIANYKIIPFSTHEHSCAPEAMRCQFITRDPPPNIVTCIYELDSPILRFAIS